MCIKSGVVVQSSRRGVGQHGDGLSLFVSSSASSHFLGFFFLPSSPFTKLLSTSPPLSMRSTRLPSAPSPSFSLIIPTRSKAPVRLPLIPSTTVLEELQQPEKEDVKIGISEQFVVELEVCQRESCKVRLLPFSPSPSSLPTLCLLTGLELPSRNNFRFDHRTDDFEENDDDALRTLSHSLAHYSSLAPFLRSH
jgi:hypothetical protein